VKYLVCIFLLITGLSSCALNEQNGLFTQSTVQTVDMGNLDGLRIIELAALSYPESSSQTKNNLMFSDKDKENFEDSLIHSLNRSGVRVMPSAQTKLHIDFTEIAMPEMESGKIISMNAQIAVSRNGIIKRKTIKISRESKLTIGATKDIALKNFILKLGDLLREQASYKQ
tara:strand:+ start:19925 stop:20437 length:513 start_codon:yes stop_codon:yes gene_type:complete